MLRPDFVPRSFRDFKHLSPVCETRSSAHASPERAVDFGSRGSFGIQSVADSTGQSYRLRLEGPGFRAPGGPRDRSGNTWN